MISHFGENPNKGGRPAKERKAKGAMTGNMVNLDQEVAKEFKERDVVLINIMNIVRVIIM